MSSSSDFDWKKKPHVLHSIIFHIPFRKKITRILERSKSVENIHGEKWRSGEYERLLRIKND